MTIHQRSKKSERLLQTGKAGTILLSPVNRACLQPTDDDDDDDFHSDFSSYLNKVSYIKNAIFTLYQKTSFYSRLLHRRHTNKTIYVVNQNSELTRRVP
jgi:hypothetical protein